MGNFVACLTLLVVFRYFITRVNKHTEDMDGMKIIVMREIYNEGASPD